jgi:hypothetical protein
MDIFYTLKPLYYLSKFVGLASFSLSFNPRTGEHVMRSSGVCNRVQNIYTVAIFCGITSGFVMCLQDVQAKLSTNPGQVVSHMFSSPANFITTMMDIILMSVVNRKEIMKLILKLRTIDDILLQGNGSRLYVKTRRRMIFELMIVFGVLIPFLCYDSYFFGQLSSHTFEVMSRFSIVISLTTVIQFLWAVRFFKHRLQLLNRKLSSGFSSHVNISKSERTCDRNAAGQSGRAVREICGIFRENNARTLTVLPTSAIKGPGFPMLQQNTSSDRVSYILNLRVTYNHIYEATLVANSVYGISIILTLMYCFVATVSNTYYTFLDSFTNFDQLEKKMSNVQYYISTHILWVILSVGKTVAISGCCHVVRMESRVLADNLQKLQLYRQIRPDVLLQLQQFATQVTENSIHFTAFGFFSINLSLLYAFIASSATYVIILIQFRLN